MAPRFSSLPQRRGDIRPEHTPQPVRRSSTLAPAGSASVEARCTLSSVPRGAPAGPRLPRKSTALSQSRAALRVAAYMIGVMLANERNRHRLTQDELGRRAGIAQVDISQYGEWLRSTAGY